MKNKTSLIFTWALLICLGFWGVCKAQIGPSGGVSLDQMNSAIASAVASSNATLMAAMPQPSSIVPLTDATTGAIGTATNSYMLANAIRPARYRSGTCTITGGAGACTITWSTPMPSTPNALGDPSALNSSPGTTQYNCNWTNITATTGAVLCRASILNIAALGPLLSYLTNGVVVTGNVVQPL